MACGWCGVAQGGDEDSHGICDQCMVIVFKIEPEEIRAEIALEEQPQREGSVPLDVVQEVLDGKA